MHAGMEDVTEVTGRTRKTGYSLDEVEMGSNWSNNRLLRSHQHPKLYRRA